MTAIHGWNQLVPELAAYGVLLKRAKINNGSLVPMNLFLHGKQGTNKSGGMLTLAKILGLSSYSLDCSTVDDINEIIGTTNLQANREHGRKELIKSKFVDLDFPFFDEFLNARPHVAPTFRQLLQRKPVVNGEPVETRWLGFGAAGNLDVDMAVGAANLLDTPTADRFALVLRVPSLAEMSFEDFEAIALDNEESSFEDNLREAMDAIESNFSKAEELWRKRIVPFLRTLSSNLMDTPYSFEGRRLQLLRDFCLATLALHAAQSKRDLKSMLRNICYDCLRYNVLSGADMSMAPFDSAFLIAYESIFNEHSMELVVAMEPSLERQMSLVLGYWRQINLVTRTNTYDRALNSDNTAFSIALKVTAKRGYLDHERPELVALIERKQIGGTPVKIPLAQLDDYITMSTVEQMSFEASNGDFDAARALAARVDLILDSWGVAASVSSEAA